MITRFFLIFLTCFCASSAKSEDVESFELPNTVKKMPESDDMALPIFKKNIKKEEIQRNFDCQTDFASLTGKMGTFSSHDDFYYHMVRVAAQKRKNIEKFRYLLMKFDLHTFAEEKILSFETQKELDAVVYYGEPLGGLSLVFFEDEAKTCLQGEAHLVHLSLSKELKYHPLRTEQASVSLLHGGYVEQVQKDNSIELSTFEQSYLYFLEKKSLLQFELSSHQARFIPMMSDTPELPLYFDMSKHRRYSWENVSPRERTLKGYSTSRSVAGMVAFSSQDKVMQDGRFFAALKIFEDKNALRIKELGSWSGKKEWQDFEVKLPQNFSVKDGAVDLYLKNQWAVLYGFKKETKKTWKNIHLFRYADKEDVIAPPQLQKNSFIKGVHFSPNGLFLVAEEVSLDKEKTKAIHFFDMSQRTWKKIFRIFEK